MKYYNYLCIGLLLLLSGCEAEIPSGSSVGSEQDGISSFDARKVGMPITDITKTNNNSASIQETEYVEIGWESLQLDGHGLKDIVAKYQMRIDMIPEGSPAEDAVMEKMQAELNVAPVNPEMDNKKIKLPGFIAPLDMDDKAMISEFLLVPYFGACIHSPPPPLSQTVLVKPQPGKSIGMEQMHEPVWVSGIISAESTQTTLANAGYQILDATVEIYQEPE
ncbi:MAG: DUF3299 domain-containing protein [Thiolinea sp.]